MLGLGLNLATGGVAILQENIALTYVGVDPAMFCAFLLAVTIQSGGEELVTRWFMSENSAPTGTTRSFRSEITPTSSQSPKSSELKGIRAAYARSRSSVSIMEASTSSPSI